MTAQQLKKPHRLLRRIKRDMRGRECVTGFDAPMIVQTPLTRLTGVFGACAVKCGTIPHL